MTAVKSTLPGGTVITCEPDLAEVMLNRPYAEGPGTSSPKTAKKAATTKKTAAARKSTGGA